MKKNRPPGSVVVLVLTSITIIFWTIYGTYQAIKKDAVLTVDPKATTPFNAGLDTETLEAIDDRIYFEENQIPESLISQQETPVPEPEIVEPEVSTESAEQSTGSAQL